jgi:hypothetical protein
VLAEIIFCAAAEYPRKAGNATYAVSVGSKISGAEAKEGEWAQPAFAAREVQHKVS